MTQSYFTGRSSYPTVLHALQAIPDEEDDSSWTILYSPRVLAPALFHHALVPSLRLVSNHIISEHLDLSEDMTPVLFHLTRLALLAVEVFITTPFELARRRLHLQRLKPPRSKLSKSQRRRLESSTRNRPMYYRRVTVDEDDLEADGGPENDELLEDLELEECMHAQPYFTSVQVSSTFYLNTWDVFQSIVKDEGGPVVKPPRRRKTALHPYSSVLRPAVTANDSAPADRLDTRVSQVATRQPPSSLAMIWSNNNSDNSGQTSPIPPAQFSPLDNWPRSASPTLGMASEWDGVEYSRALHSSKLNASITELPNPSPPSTSSVYPPPRSSSPTYSIASTSYTSYSAVKMASMYRPGTWHSFWVGLQSLYRSVGANYTREVIYYGFNELKKLDSDW